MTGANPDPKRRFWGTGSRQNRVLSRRLCIASDRVEPTGSTNASGELQIEIASPLVSLCLIARDRGGLRRQSLTVKAALLLSHTSSIMAVLLRIVRYTAQDGGETEGGS